MLESAGNRWTAKPGAAGGRVEAALLKIVDGGMAGVIFIVPWIMGGRDAIGQLILATLAVLTALAWFVRQAIRGGNVCRPMWPLVLAFIGAAFLLLQTIPLPKAFLDCIVPRQTDLLPLWNGAANESLGRWAVLSFAPAETRAGLVLFISYALLFIVTVQRVRGVEDIERILRWCALSAIAMALFGMVQLVAGNGKFYWFFEHPYTNTLRSAKGGFTNSNHFAHFLALGLGPLVWWLHSSIQHGRKKPAGDFSIASNGNFWKEPKTPLLGLALAVVAFAGILSLSRGGIAAICLAVAVSAAFCYKSSAGIGRVLGTLAAAGILIVSALWIFGLDQVVPRVESALDIANPKVDWSSSRFALWETTMKAIPDFSWTGTGAGSFSDVYPIYEDGTLPDQVEFTHAENSPLHNLLENGVFSCGFLITGLATCVFWCAAGWKCNAKLKTCAGAIAAGLCVCTAQAMVDFIWYVPACAAMTTILAACAWRVRRLSMKPKASTSTPPPRWFAFAAAAALIPIGIWMICNRLGPAIAEPRWNHYLVAHFAAKASKSSEAKDESAARARDLEAVALDLELIDGLENVVYWDPDHARAHLALTEVHLRLFEALRKTGQNRMPLLSIRDAVLASDFPSRESLNRWLDRAVGAPAAHLTAALRHCRQSLALRPLQGHGYVYLAELSFLDGNRPVKEDCIGQALRLRPFDGAIAFAAASEALLAGDEPRWLELAKRSFDRGPKYQRQIIGELVGRTPPEQIQDIIDFIDTYFQPDREGVEILYGACAKRCPPEKLAGLCRTRAELAETEAMKLSGPNAAGLWLWAQHLYTGLGDGSRALYCARNAMRSDPNNYRAHYQLAECMLEQKMFAEAESELEWCRQRKSGDANLDSQTKEAIKARLNAERSDAASAMRK
jgi:hypothetical protein